MPPKSKTNDANDVLDFINSLPDSKSGTPILKGNIKDEKDEDLLEFLDELAAHEKSKPSTPTPGGKFEPKQKNKKKKEEEGESRQAKSGESQESSKDAPTDEEPAGGSSLAGDGDKSTGNDEKSDEVDPISSISNWWNKEGSSKVSELWGSITSNAQTISEQTYQIASNTSNQLSQQRQKLIENADHEHILSVTSRLNSILLGMSQQITQGLMDDSDELLNIMLVYDLYNINYLDQLCSTLFNTVMRQVEGGIQVTVNNFNHKDELTKDNIDLNLFYGKVIDGEKLCFANLDSLIKDYLRITKLDEEASGDSQEKEDINKINKSNIFISVQPITSRSTQEEPSANDGDSPTLIESNNADSFSFTFILKDITNNITIITKSQPFPLKWAKWLNGDIAADIKELGDVNPSEWVKDWIKNGLSLSFGVLAQEYVIKRMGF